MRIYIMTDIEGVSGVVKYDSKKFMSANGYLERRKWGYFLTLEVNAAVKGAFESGAAEITVCDGHGCGDMLDLEILDSRVSAVIGHKRKAWLPFFNESYDALIMVGAHSMEGTLGGVLAHTYSHRTIKGFILNNKSIGEIGITAAVAGSYGVPTIFISGDRAAVEEAKAIIPEIFTAVVKEGITNLCSKTLLISQSMNLIKSGVKNALENLHKIKPFKIYPPYELEVYYKSPLVLFYKWISTKSYRPKFISMNGVVFRSQNNLSQLLEKFKAF